MKQDEMVMIPFVVHEGDMARTERVVKRLAFLVMIESLLIGVLICRKHTSV